MYIIAEQFSLFLHNFSPLYTCFFSGREEDRSFQGVEEQLFLPRNISFRLCTLNVPFRNETFLNNKIMTQAMCYAAQGLLFRVPMSRITWLSTSKLSRFQRNFQNEIQCSNFCRLVKWLKG